MFSSAMSLLRFALRFLHRNFRAGELGVLATALLVSVASLTAVGLFTSRVSRAVEEQSSEMLAGDLRLRSAESVDPAYIALARQRGLATAELAWLPSLVTANGKPALATVRAVSDEYPLKGRLRVADAPFAAGREVDDIPAPGEAWVESSLLVMLRERVGSTFKVGALELTITRVLDYRPDQGIQFADYAPTLLMRLDELPATKIVMDGSLVNYAALFAGERKQVAAFKQELGALRKSGERLVDVADMSPQVRASMDRAVRFLNLVVLASVLLAAVAVAIATRSYVKRHLDSAALMKSLGVSQRGVLTIHLTGLAVLGIMVGVLGSVLGFAAQELLGFLMRHWVGSALPPPAPGAAWLGLVTALVILLGFALPALLQLRHVPPARVLRRNLDPPPLRYSLVYGAAFAAMVAIIAWRIQDAELLYYVVLGVLGTFAVLYFAGWLLVQALATLRSSVGVSWRFGIVNIARRGRESIVQIVAFGLGLMAILLLVVVRADLMHEWRASIPADAPNHYLVNVNPESEKGLRALLQERKVEPPRLVPILKASMVDVNGVSVRELQGLVSVDQEAGFFRSFNATSAREPPLNSRLVSGSWWSADGTAPSVSVEQGVAKKLKLKLGDEITYRVAGENVSAKVANILDAADEIFLPKFHMIFSPGVLRSQGTLLGGMRLTEEQRPVLLDVMQRFPEITIIEADKLMKEFRSATKQASLAIQYVFGFTLFAGLAVLLAAIEATRHERRYESAMLRTFGATRRVVLQGVAAEFAMLGLLSGTLAACGASLGGYLLATRLFNLEYTLNFKVWIFGLLAGALFVGLAGLLATRSVVLTSPASTLR